MSGQLNGYEKRTQNKRAAIIQAAQALFAEKGIGPVSITEIAERAQVSRVTLFKYYGDKDNLVRQAMQSWVETLIAEYEGIVSGDGAFEEKLLALLALRVSGRTQIGEQFIASAAWEDPEMKRTIFEMAQSRAFPIVRQFLKDGQAANVIDSGLDEQALLTYLSAVAPLLQNPEIIKKGPAFQTSLFNLFMGGLVKNWYSIRDSDGVE